MDGGGPRGHGEPGGTGEERPEPLQKHTTGPHFQHFLHTEVKTTTTTTTGSQTEPNKSMDSTAV